MSDLLLDALRTTELRSKGMRAPYHFVTKTCPYCKWPFQCSTEQMDRLACHACASLR